MSQNHPGLKTTSICGIPVTRTDYRNQYVLSCVPGKQNGVQQEDRSLLAFWSVDVPYICLPSVYQFLRNLVPRVFVPYCACWLDETSRRFRSLVKGNEDVGYEGGFSDIDLVTCVAFDGINHVLADTGVFRYKSDASTWSIGGGSGGGGIAGEASGNIQKIRF